MRAQQWATVAGLIVGLIVGSTSGQAQPATTTAASAPAPEVTVEHLLVLIPGDLTAEPRPASFDVAGSFRAGHLRFRFRLAQRPPGDAMLYLEGLDGIPMLLFAANQALVYDGARGQLLHITDAAVEFRFQPAGKQLTVGASLKAGQAPPDRTVTAAVDLRGVARTTADLTVEPLGGRRYALWGMSPKGSRTRCHFDLDAPVPFEGMEIIVPGDARGDFSLRVDRATLGQPVDVALFTFPTPNQMVAVAPRHLDDEDPAAGDEGFDMLTRTFLFQFAQLVPAERQRFEKLTGPIDWERRRRENERLSAPLRALMGSRYPQPPAAAASTSPATLPATFPRDGD